jgi:hypothetical protein
MVLLRNGASYLFCLLFGRLRGWNVLERFLEFKSNRIRSRLVSVLRKYVLTYRLKTKLGVRVLVGRWIWVVVSEKVPHGSTS